MNKEEAIRTAQQTIIGNFTSTNQSFHQYSFIYKTSNEDFNLYKELYNKKQNILTVEGSGDQILNAISENILDITAFDISTFPKYFTDLKLAAILTCNQEKFEEFFYQLSTYDKDFNEEIFEIIFNTLKNTNFNNWNPKESLEFWQKLFCFFDGYDIYNSRLFSSEPFSLSSIKKKNSFLEPNIYKKIKENIPNLKLTHKVGNIIDLAKDHSKEYELINLSNIFTYLLDETGKVSLQNYLKLLENLPLTKDGIAITYLFNLTNQITEYIKNIFQDTNYEIIKDSNHNSTSAVLVYKK